MSYCDCSGSLMYNVSKCTKCFFDGSGNLLSSWDTSGNVAIKQKRIWNQVRVPSSEYSMNLASLTVSSDDNKLCKNNNNYGNWNQMSDRINPHKMKFQNHPSRGNSTKATLTSIKPGACSPGGIGVDVKHDSYARYLARKKGRNIRTQSDNNAATKPKYGNKKKKYGIISNSEYCCNNNCS